MLGHADDTPGSLALPDRLHPQDPVVGVAVQCLYELTLWLTLGTGQVQRLTVLPGTHYSTALSFSRASSISWSNASDLPCFSVPSSSLSSTYQVEEVAPALSFMLELGQQTAAWRRPGLADTLGVGLDE